MKQLTQKLKSGRMDVLEVPVPDLKPGMILVRNLYSLISAGTEGGKVATARKGYIGKAKEKPQQAKKVIDTLMSQGPVQTYRAVMKKLDAHTPLGYSCVGTVVQAPSSPVPFSRATGQAKLKAKSESDGGETANSSFRIPNSEFRVGDLVACGGETACHAEVIAVPEMLCVKLSQRLQSAEGLDGIRSAVTPGEFHGVNIEHSEEYLQMAAYNTLGAIAMQGVRQADLRLGETCAVIGMGLLGHLTAALLKASGVRVIGIDVDPAMVELGREHCLDLGLVRDDLGIESKNLDFCCGIGCDAVIITAASNSLDPINFAGEISRKKGTVVVVGTVPTGFDRDPHFYKKELTVKMSCSYGPGRYDSEYEEKGRDYPVGYVRWTEKRNMQAFQELIASGKIDISYLTTHVFKLEDAPKAYDMIVEKSEPFVGILIKYDPQITQIDADFFVSRKGAKALRDEDPHPSGMDSVFHGAGITQITQKEKDKLATDPHRQTQMLQEDVSRKGAPVPSSGATGQAKAQKIQIKKPTSDLRHTSSVSIGFIGAGSYAQSYLLPNIPKGKDVVLKGVMTSTPTSSRSVADRFGFEFCTGNADDILKNDEINTVFIATRHDSHGYYVKRALEAGKHVFVEKPLCLTKQDLETIQSSIFNLQSSILMVGYNRRFSPLTSIIKERLNQGPFSMLYRINAGMVPSDSWVQDMEVGGGRILGEVCHFVDYLTFMSGSLPVSVFATTMEDANNHNDSLTVSLKYQNGSVGSIQYYANGSKSLAKEYVEIYAHGVTAVLNDFRELKIYGKGKPFKKKLISQDKGQKNEVQRFIDLISEGGPPLISPEEIFNTSKVTFAILDSIRTAQRIKLSADYPG